LRLNNGSEDPGSEVMGPVHLCFIALTGLYVFRTPSVTDQLISPC